MQRGSHLTVTVAKTKVEQLTQFKYLGLVFDASKGALKLYAPDDLIVAGTGGSMQCVTFRMYRTAHPRFPAQCLSRPNCESSASMPSSPQSPRGSLRAGLEQQ